MRLLLLISFYFHFLLSCQYSVGKEYNKEPELLHHAQLMRHQRNQNMKRKNLLCVSFYNPSVTATTVLMSNILIMDSKCDWAIVFYDGDPEISTSVCQISTLKRFIIHCKRATESLTPRYTKIPVSRNRTNYIEQKLSIPKTVLYRELLPFLPLYEKVFLLDEDISLINFNITSLLQLWNCAFTPQPPPLLVQPLIYESLQYYPFVNMKFWRWGTRKKILASGVGIVEQQIPLLDSIFFEWFVADVLSLTKEEALKQGVDQGHDRTWCNAARDYMQVVLNYTDVTPCAVITGCDSVHHLNSRSLANKRTNRQVYRERGRAVVDLYSSLFPSWFASDMRGAVNPVHPEFRDNYKKIKKLDKSCLENLKKSF